MANSIKEYTYHGSQGSNPIYAAPDYLEGRAATDIQVWVGDKYHLITKLEQDTHYTITNTGVEISGYTLTEGEHIYIKRVSSPDERLTAYVDGSLLTADTLDADANQLFYLSQEALDEASKANMAAGDFYHAGDTPPTRTVNDQEVPPPNGTLWYDTQSSPNVLKIYNGTEWYAAAPVKTVNEYFMGNSELQNHNSDLDVIYPNNYIAGAEVLLNGVQLRLASALNMIDLGTPAPANGDYWYDETNGKFYLKSISADDRLVIRSYSGGYSTQVTESEANVEAMTTLFNSKYEVMNPKLDTVIALDIDTKRQDILDSEARTQQIHDDTEDLKDLTKQYATSDTAFVNEDGVSTDSAKTYSEEAKSEADRAYEIANGTQETLDGWVAIDNETITTKQTANDPILYSKTKLTLKSDDRVLIDSPLEIAAGLELTGSTTLDMFGIITPIVVGRAFLDHEGPSHELWEGSPDVTVERLSNGRVKISHPDFEVDKMTIVANYCPDFRGGFSSQYTKSYAITTQPNDNNTITLQAERDGGTSNSTYAIQRGAISVVVYKF